MPYLDDVNGDKLCIIGVIPSDGGRAKSVE